MVHLLLSITRPVILLLNTEVQPVHLFRAQSRLEAPHEVGDLRVPREVRMRQKRRDVQIIQPREALTQQQSELNRVESAARVRLFSADLGLIGRVRVVLFKTHAVVVEPVRNRARRKVQLGREKFDRVDARVRVEREGKSERLFLFFGEEDALLFGGQRGGIAATAVVEVGGVVGGGVVTVVLGSGTCVDRRGKKEINTTQYSKIGRSHR